MLLLLFAAPASAGQLTSRDLPRGCYEDTDGVIAFACDPARQASAATLSLGGRVGRGQLDGAEPLQPGETLTLTWSHPSRRAILYLFATAPTGARSVIVNLREGAERVDVRAGDDGSVTVTPGGVVPTPQPRHVVWDAHTPVAAARAVLHAVRHMERSFAAVQTLCASLAGGVLDYFSFGHPTESEACLEGMALSIAGDENVPAVVSTHAAGLSVAVSGSRAVMRTRLTHRYRPNSIGDPRTVALTARALLVRDSAGGWRLATPEALLPLFAVSYRRPLSDSRLRALYHDTASRGRALTRHQVRVRRQATARIVPHPCSVPLVADPSGDVLVETVEPARDQAAHAGGDMVGAGFDGRCLALRTAGPLAGTFSVVAGDKLNLRVTNGTVEAYSGDEADDLVPIRGAVAQLDSGGLSVLLPRRLAGVTSVDLNVDVSQVRYGDTLKFGGG